MTIKPPELFDGITGEVWSALNFYNIIKNESWIAYIGAGVAASTHGTWNSLIKDLCNACNVAYTNEELESEDGKLQLADIALSSNSIAFQKFLYDRFGGNNQNTSVAYSPIMHLPFTSFLTTNYDNGPRLFRPELPVNVYKDIRYKDIISGGIFYLHGKINTPNFNINEIVLGKDSHDSAYAESSLKTVLPTLFLEDNVMVFGARLREKPLRNILSEVNKIKNTNIEKRSPKKNKLIIIIGSEFSFDQLYAPVAINEYSSDIEKQNRRKQAQAQENIKREISEYEKLGFKVLCYYDHNEKHLNFNKFLEAVHLEHQPARTSWSPQ
jgi:hypothetical protein